VDTVPPENAPQEIEQDHAAPCDPEATAKMCAFMACEAFTPFVLDCLSKAARDAVAEQTKPAPDKRPTE
jgi:hypothetical protein